jgi:TP901 family phage tail tape measure protein
MSQSIQIQVTQVGLEQSIAAAMKRVGSSSQINLGTNSRQINALSQPLGRITGQADEFSKSMAAANARVLAFGASAGIISAVAKSMQILVSSTINVEKSLVEIGSVLNRSGSELDKFGKDIFNVAKNTGKSFDEVAKGALELARQGLGAEDTLSRLSDAMILSRLSGLEAAQSVEGLTAAFNSFKSSGITTAEILNKVVAVSQKFAVSERDIIEGLGRSASVADLAGVSFDELAALITAIQQKTSRGGAVIGNSLKTIFARIQDKTVLSDLQKMGIGVTDLANGKVLPALKILENLAAEMEGFDQIEQADISKKLGGIFQLDKLLAALKDLSSEASVTGGALKASAEAGNSAYKKNILYNETLDSILNKVSVSAEQLGSTLGKIGVTDNLKNILGFFNNLLEGIQNILGEESGLGSLVQGLVKGLGGFLAGPGLALFGGIILKLSKDLIQFGFASLKSFFGIGKAAKDIQNVETSISQILSRNVNLQQQLFQLEGNRVGQLQLITNALIQQEALMRKSSQISAGLAKPLYNVGARATDSGLRLGGNSAGGYMPAVAKESSAIKQGVGGARSGDKPVVMPNFNFGGGKKGTMVAHTGEYIVPNFNGSGGSAVFNRRMVQSMGLPSGAKKIGSAGGFVPNFARKTLSGESGGSGPAAVLNLLNYENLQSVPQVRDAISKYFKVTKSGKEALTVDYQGKEIRISNANMQSRLSDNSQSYNANAKPNSAVMLIAQNQPFNLNQANTDFKKENQEKYGYSGFLGGVAGVAENLSDSGQNKISKISNIDDSLQQALSSAAFSVVKQIGPDIISDDSDSFSAKNIKNTLEKGGPGAFASLKGALFDSIISKVAGAKGRAFNNTGSSLDVDFNAGSPKSREIIETIFGLPADKFDFADFKVGMEQKDKYINQVVSYLPKDRDISKSANAAGGYVPNFAEDDNEKIAEASSSSLFLDKYGKLKVDMLRSRTGNPLFTLAKLIKKRQIKSIDGGAIIGPRIPSIILALQEMVEKERAKDPTYPRIPISGMFKPQYLSDKVNTLSETKQRKLNPDAFTGNSYYRYKAGDDYFGKKDQRNLIKSFKNFGLKSKDKNFFKLQNYYPQGLADGYLPNFANPLKDAVGREMAAGVPSSQIYVDKNSSLKSAMNPMGLMVANRRDEPAGGFQGINRARKEGANPMMYGSAGGFVPNYANLKTKDFPNASTISAENLTKLNEEIKRLNKSIKDTTLTYDLAEQELKAFIGGLKTTKGKTISPKTADTISSVSSSSLKESKAGAGRDMLGTIFAVQGALSALTASTEGADDELAKLTNGLTSVLGAATTVVFASQGLSQAFGGVEKGMGKFVGQLGIYGAVAIGLYTAFKEYAKYLDSNNPAILKAAEASSRLAESANRAALNLNNINPATKQRIEKESDISLKDIGQYSQDESNVPITLVQGLINEVINFGRDSAYRKTDIAGGLTDDLKKDILSSMSQARGIGMSKQSVIDIVLRQAKEGELNYAGETQITGEEAEIAIDELNSAITKITNNPNASPEIAFENLSEEYKKQLGQLTQEQLKFVLENTGKISNDRSLEKPGKGNLRLLNKPGVKELTAARDTLFDAGVKDPKILDEATRKVYQLAQDRKKQEDQTAKTSEKSYRINTSRMQAEYAFEEKMKAYRQAASNFEIIKLEEISKLEQDRTISDDDRAKKIAEINTGLSNQISQLKTIEERQKNINTAVLDSLTGALGADQNDLSGIASTLTGALPAIDINDLKDFKKQLKEILDNQLPGSAENIFEPLAENLIKAQIANQNLTDAQKLQAQEAAKKLGIDLQIIDAATTQLSVEKRINNEIESRNSTASFNIEKRVLNNAYEALSVNKEIEEVKRKTSLNELQKSEQIYKLELKRRELESKGIGISLDKELLNIDQELREKSIAAFGQSKTLPKDILDSSNVTADQLLEASALDSSTRAAIQRAIDNANQRKELAIEGNKAQQAGVAPVLESDIQIRAREGFRGGMERATNSLQEQIAVFESTIGEKIPQMFSDNMSSAINKMIEGGESFGDVLQGAAYEFVKGINQANIQNLSNKFSNSLFDENEKTGETGIGSFIKNLNLFASGGKVTGGSGSKDDVPAMLMGGEYVVNKKAVSKYGSQFMESINNGTLNGYAKGGKVQKGPQGNFYAPGTFGQGAITGKTNLLDFATQTGTSGQFDKMFNVNGYQSIALEPESSRLSVSGMRNSPMFEATQSAKGQAFDLYLQQYNAERQAKKQAKEQRKALITQLIMLVGSAALGQIGKKATTDGSDAVKALGENAKFSDKAGAFFGGAYSSIKSLFTPKPSTVGQDNVIAAGAARTGGGVVQYDNIGGLPQKYVGQPDVPYDGSPVLPPKPKPKAIGGMIPSRSGIDTVPAMLSGGEFVMNRSAVQSIGAPNLQSMNSGGTSITSEETSKQLNEKLLAKLDELINSSGSAGNITINVAPSGQTSQETSQDPSAGRQQLARQIKDAVLQIINDEKRIGGSLRR